MKDMYPYMSRCWPVMASGQVEVAEHKSSPLICRESTRRSCAAIEGFAAASPARCPLPAAQEAPGPSSRCDALGPVSISRGFRGDPRAQTGRYGWDDSLSN
ncbi:hypothetical protein CSOJ01_06232 [Colletotrichum sojae]|uniref:Uncharacterized protein n=1 Tax=Colletotrichum sojae TaxID=2175907 RepID=A0A8H6JCU5_9PEZI|nr:hypothetical protein CSOJ01_06232 [Colletotrichum sojae]